MVERICPRCQHGNPVENRFCGQCGAPMGRTLPEPQHQDALAMSGSVDLSVRLKQLGRVAAVSLTALAIEAGVGWLRRRIEHFNQPAYAPPQTAHPVSAPYTVSASPGPPATTTQSPPTSIVVPAQPSGVVTILSQRVVETWEQGVLTRQTVERNVWRREQGE